jgi:hypothetical protein
MGATVFKEVAHPHDTQLGALAMVTAVHVGKSSVTITSVLDAQVSDFVAMHKVDVLIDDANMEF